MRDEHWRPVPMLPWYEVSDLGRVRNALTGKFIRPFNGYGRNGRYYKKVCLYDRGRRSCLFVHRLVIYAFYEADHKDRNRSNNTLENLEPVTRRENDRRWREGL